MEIIYFFVHLPLIIRTEFFQSRLELHSNSNIFEQVISIIAFKYRQWQEKLKDKIFLFFIGIFLQRHLCLS